MQVRDSTGGLSIKVVRVWRRGPTLRPGGVSLRVRSAARSARYAAWNGPVERTSPVAAAPTPRYSLPWSQLTTRRGVTTTPTRLGTCRSTSARPASPRSPIPALLRDPGRDRRADRADVGRVAQQLRLPAERDTAQVEVRLTVLDQAGDPGVALQVADLLGGGVGPEGEATVVAHDVEQRGQVGAAVGAHGGDLHLPLPGEVGAHLVVGHLDPVPAAGRHVPVMPHAPAAVDRAARLA